MWRRIFYLMAVGLLLPAAAWAETESLEQAWIDAYRFNPSLQSERAGLRATDEQVAQAQSHWRPNIQATATYGKTYQYIPGQEPYGTAAFCWYDARYGVAGDAADLSWFSHAGSETEAAEMRS